MAKKVGSHKKVCSKKKAAITEEAVRLGVIHPDGGGMASKLKLPQLQHFAKKLGIVLDEMALYKLLGVSQRNKRERPDDR